MSRWPSAGRILVCGALVVGMVSCSSDATSDGGLDPSTVTVTTEPPNAAVTERARVALTAVGARRLVPTVGHEQEPNTALEGTWRGHPLLAYVVPTSALPPSDELTLVGRSGSTIT